MRWVTERNWRRRVLDTISQPEVIFLCAMTAVTIITLVGLR